MKGSLGGLQVVSLCEGAGIHTRIISVGQESAPPASSRLATALATELYRGLSANSLASNEEKALVFKVKRCVESQEDYVQGDSLIYDVIINANF